MRNQGFFWNKKATVTFRTQTVYLYWGGSSWKLQKKKLFWTSGNFKHQKDTKSSPKGTAAKKVSRLIPRIRMRVEKKVMNWFDCFVKQVDLRKLIIVLWCDPFKYLISEAMLNTDCILAHNLHFFMCLCFRLKASSSFSVYRFTWTSSWQFVGSKMSQEMAICVKRRSSNLDPPSRHSLTFDHNACFSHLSYFVLSVLTNICLCGAAVGQDNACLCQWQPHARTTMFLYFFRMTLELSS